MRIDVISVFPEVFEPYLGVSMLGRALEAGVWEFRPHDLRDWTHDNHRTVDDAPYGGGPGMVMKPEPVFEALDAVAGLGASPGHVVVLAPTGKPFSQDDARRLSQMDRLILVSGRYEGLDERILDRADEVISIGDYVLTGGELPAMVVIDAVVRLLPGVLGHELSSADESFADSLLEYPQYTRPPVYADREVPEVLLSGDHARVAAYRREQALRRTAQVRPDLLDGISLTEDERRIVAEELDGLDHDDR
jgi:tRNA (guanine37-N1)-methyltransferase